MTADIFKIPIHAKQRDTVNFILSLIEEKIIQFIQHIFAIIEWFRMEDEEVDVDDENS